MSQTLISALDQLVQALATLSGVQAVGLAGGNRPLPEPGTGDIDLFIYCSHIPSLEKRQAILSALNELAENIQINQLTGGHWGSADSLSLARVETWLMYFTVQETQAELAEVLSGQYPGRLDDYYYPIGRCALLQGIRPLHDPDGILAQFREQIVEYPPKLAQTNLTYHLDKLTDTEDLDRAVRRGDVLFYHFALDLAIDHFLLALFALNRCYFPSRKRSLEYIARFNAKPADCKLRLLKVVELGARAATLAHSRACWDLLVLELRTLAHRAVL